MNSCTGGGVKKSFCTAKLHIVQKVYVDYNAFASTPEQVLIKAGRGTLSNLLDSWSPAPIASIDFPIRLYLISILKSRFSDVVMLHPHLEWLEPLALGQI